MPTLVPELLALSWPGTPRGPRAFTFGELVCELQRGYVRGLLRRTDGALHAAAPELCAWLELSSEHDAWLREPLSTQAALVDSLERGTGGERWLAALLGLELHARGERAAWSIELERARPLRYGRWFSPPVTTVRAEDTQLCLDSRWLDPTQEDELERAGFTRLPCLSWHAQLLTLVPTRYSELCPVKVEGRADEAVSLPLTSVLCETFALLESCSPAYVPWILDALRTLVPVRRPDGGAHRSGSFTGVPGVVVIGVPLAPVDLAELLVHEASHQYLLAARASYRLSNGRDAGLYQSPFPKQPRPIEGILVGYHAFANIARLQRDLTERAPRAMAGVAEAWLAQWDPELQACERMLSESPGLTRHGQSFYQPIAAELRGQHSKTRAPQAVLSA